MIAIAAALSDCDSIEDIAEWGRTKEGVVPQIPGTQEWGCLGEDLSAHLPGPRPEAIRNGVPPLGGWGGQYPDRRLGG